MLRLATAVSSYPFYNFRYLKLLSEFSKYFSVYVFAGSKLKLKKMKSYGDGKFYRVYYLFPFSISRRIRYRIGGMLSRMLVNLVKPDLVWLFDTTGPLFPLIINRPTVLDLDDPVFNHGNKLSLLKDLYVLRNRYIRKIVVPTEMIKQKFIKLYDIPEDKIEVVPNGVDLRLFRATDIPDDDVVLYYGTLAPYRSRFLVKVIENVLMLRKDVKFIVVGDVPAWFKEYLVKNDLINNVIMPEFVEHDKLPEWIKKAKVCIFTQDMSLGGRFPSKLIEYMASGRPVVATDVDESWPIRESGAGIIVPLDPRMFAENVIKLLEDKKLSEELARKGVEYVRRFSWDNIIRKYVGLLMEIIESSKSADKFCG